MKILIMIVIGFLSAVIGSMGLGGGGILLLYLVNFTRVSQLAAQGINLVFFIPVAVLSIIFHAKNKLIKKETLLVTIIPAIAFCILGFFVSTSIDESFIRKGFGIFLIFIASRELIASFRKNKGT